MERLRDNHALQGMDGFLWLGFRVLHCKAWMQPLHAWQVLDYHTTTCNGHYSCTLDNSVWTQLVSYPAYVPSYDAG